MKHYLLLFFFSLYFLSFTSEIHAQLTFDAEIIEDGCENATYKFSNVKLAGVVLDLATTRFDWDFGNGNNIPPWETGTSTIGAHGTVGQPEASYAGSGTYTVTVRIDTNTDNIADATATKQIIVYKAASPDFVANNLSGCVNHTINLTDQTNTTDNLVGDVESWRWRFGNGDESTDENPTYTYTTPGTYQVTLTVNTYAGGKETCEASFVRTDYISVKPTPEVDFALANGPACGSNFTAVFNNNSTIDGGGTIDEYKWTFYDSDGVSVLDTKIAEDAIQAYTAYGSYNVKLEATSTDNCVADKTIFGAVTLTDWSPDFTWLTNDPLCDGESVQFLDASGLDAQNWVWDFGDGSSTVTDKNPTHTFDDGTYNVTLTVTFSDGCIKLVQKAITINPKPNTDFTISPDAGFCRVPIAVAFNKTSPIVGETYEWNFGDPFTGTGGTAIGDNVNHTYTGFGTLTPELTVTGVNGCKASEQLTLNLEQPVVDFSILTTPNGCAPQTIDFQASITSNDQVVEQNWNFDGGADVIYTNPAIPPTASHSYAAGGEYNVRLKITTQNGCTAELTKTGAVQIGVQPTFVATPITVSRGDGAAGTGCRRDGLGNGITISTDFDVASSVVDSIEWDLGDGSGIQKQLTPPYTLDHLFEQNGAITISATAYNNGCPVTVSYPITVDGPVARFVVPNNIACTGGSTITFDNLSSSDAGGAVYDWDFGDGTVQNGVAKGSGISHNYPGTGDYIVRMTVTEGGCTDWTEEAVNITSNVADFDVVYTNVDFCGSANINFEDKSTTSPNGEIKTWEWLFGDGASVTNTTNATVSHNYDPANSDYTVTLNITDANGCTETATKSVTVYGPKPSFTALPDKCTNEAVTMTDLSITYPASPNPTPASITKWVWEFGDGDTHTENAPWADPKDVSHSYTTSGDYNVQLTVFDSRGCQETFTRQVTIKESPNVDFKTVHDKYLYCTKEPDTNTPVKIDFQSTTTPPSGETVSLVWDFDDPTGTVFNAGSATPSFQYSKDGVHNVKLTATATNNCVADKTISVETISPWVTLYADGKPENSTGTPIVFSCPEDAIDFEGKEGSNSYISTWGWDFGDGNTNDIQNPTHQYLFPGLYDVKLTATSDAFANVSSGTIQSCVLTRSIQDFIDMGGPEADVSYSPDRFCVYDEVNGEPVDFELKNIVDAVEATWDYGDGSTNTYATNSTSLQTVHNYQAGVYLPNVVLRDNASCRVTYSAPSGSILASAVPEANFYWSGNSSICQTKDFEFFDDSEDAEVPPGDESELKPEVTDWEWFFYDDETGTVVKATSNVENPPALNYPVAGNKKVTLKVTNGFNPGCWSQISKTVTIVEPSIKADFTYAPSNICPSQDVSFNSTSESKSGGTVLPIEHQWTFIQGGTNGTEIGSSDLENPDFTFPTEGNYTVKLLVTDEAQCAGDAVKVNSITVDPIPTFDIAPSDVEICETETADVTFTARADNTSIDFADGVIYQWEYKSPSGSWSNVPGETIVSATTISADRTTTLTVPQNSTYWITGYQFRLSARQRGTSPQCLNATDAAELTIYEEPAGVGTNGDQDLCDASSFNLKSDAPTTGVGVWSQVSGSTVSFNATDRDQNINISKGQYQFKWSVSNGVCPAEEEIVLIRNGGNAEVVSSTIEQCEQATVDIEGNDPTAWGGTGVWTQDAGNPAGATFANNTLYRTTVNGLVGSGTVYKFTWTTTDGGCGITNETITVTNNPLPNITVHPVDASVCEGQDVNFAASAGSNSYRWQIDQGGTGVWSDISDGVSPSGTFANTSTNTITISAVSGTQNTDQFRAKVISAQGCVDYTNPAVLSVVTQTPNNTIVDASVCNGDNATITIKGAKGGYTYELIDASDVSRFVQYDDTPGADGDLDFVINNVTADISYIVHVITSGGANACQMDLAQQADITIKGNRPVTGAITTADSEVCEQTTGVTFSVPNNVGSTYHWTVPAGATIDGATNGNSITVDFGTFVASPLNIQVYEENAAGCEDQSPESESIIVNAKTALTFDPISARCKDGVIQTLTSLVSPSPPSPPGSGVFSGNGVNIDQFDPSDAAVVEGLNLITYTYTDPTTGCISTASQNARVYGLPTATLTVSNGQNPTCAAAPIELTAGVSGTWYTLYEEGSTFAENSTGIFDVNAPVNGNDYKVKVEDINGCVAESPIVTYVVNTLPDKSLNVNDATICQGNTAAVIINNSVVGVDYQLRFNSNNSNVGAAIAGNGGDITFNVGPSTTTQYNVLATETTATPNCWVQLDDIATVTVNSLADISTPVSDNPSICSSTVQADVILINTEPSVRYQWFTDAAGTNQASVLIQDGDANDKDGVANNQIMFQPSPSSTTTYHIFATAANGCKAKLNTTSTVSVDNLLDVAITLTDDKVCLGNNATITMTGALTGVDYTLKKQSDDTDAAASQSITTAGDDIDFVLTPPLGTQQYYISANVQATGCERTYSVLSTVTVGDNPTSTNSITASDVCNGESTTINVLNTDVNFTYNLRADGINTLVSSSPGNGGTLGFNVTPTADPSTYYIEVLKSHSGFDCSANIAYKPVIDLWDQPVAFTLALSAASYCEGGSGVEITLPSTENSVTYELYLNGNPTGNSVVGNGGNRSFGSNTAAGTYSVLATTANGCKLWSSNTEVLSIDPSPVAPTSVTVDRNNFCTDDASTIQLTAVGGSGTTTGWFTGSCSGTLVTSSVGNSITIDSPTATTTYFARWENAGCGTSDCAQITVNVNALPTVSISAIDDVCIDNGSVTLNQGSPVGGTYTSSVPAAVTGNQFNPVTATAGTHTITYTYTDGNGCSNSNNGTITVHANPTVTFPNPAAVCVNSSNFALSGATPLGGEYTSATIGAVTAGQFRPSDAGVGLHTLYYEYTDAVTGCKDKETAAIDVTDLPAVSVGTFASVCADGPLVTLSTGLPVGGTYSGTGVNSTTSEFNPSLTGVGAYTITYSFNDGTCDNSATNTIVVNPLPAVSFAAVEDQCVNDPDYTFTDNNSGVHSGNGVTGNVFSPSSAGVGTHELTYTYTDPTTKCSKAESQWVTVHPLPTVTFSSLSPVCANTSDVNLATSVNVSGGTFSGTGVVGSVFRPSNVTPGQTYTITYEYTNGNSCTQTVMQTIEVNPLPTVNFDPLSQVCVTDAAFTLDKGTPLGGKYSGPGVTTATSQFDPSSVGFGTHTLTYEYTDANVCTSSATQSIVVNPLPTVALADFDEVCENDGQIILNNGAPVGGEYSGTGVQADKITFKPTAANVGTNLITYTYTGTWCSASQTKPLVVNSLPKVYTVSGGGDFCEGTSGVAVNLSDSEFGVTYQLQRNGGATTIEVVGDGNPISFTNIDIAGTYTVVATNQKTCKIPMNGSAVVTEKPLPVAATIAQVDGDGYCEGDNASRTIRLSLADGSGDEVQWYQGGCGTALVESSLGSTVEIPAPTTEVTYYGRWSNSCGVTVCQPITVDLKDKPNVNFAVMTGVCRNASPITLTQGSPVGGIYTGDGIVGLDKFDPSHVDVEIGLNTLTYTYTDPVSTCESSDTQEIEVFDLPDNSHVLKTDGDKTEYCEGSGGIEVYLETSDASVVYDLLEGGTNVVSSRTSVGGHLSFGDQLAGTYTVRATTTNSCALVIAGPITLTESPLPTAPTLAIVGGDGYCEDNPQDITLTLSGGTGTDSQWFTGGCGGTVVTSSASNTVTLSGPTSNTTYYGRWSNACGVSACQSITVEVKPKPTVTLAALPQVCEGGAAIELTQGLPISGTYSGAGVSGTTYTPSLSAGLNTITYTYSDGNGCTDFATGDIVVNAIPTDCTVQLADASTTGSYCEGASGLEIELLASVSGVDYELYKNNVATGTIVAGTGGTISFGDQTDGTYKVEAKNPSGCTRFMSNTITINENALPTAPTSAVVAGDEYCSDVPQNVTLTLTGGTGTTAKWYTGGCGGALVTSSLTNSIVIAGPSTTTTYFGSWSNACGESACQAVTVTVNPKPTVNLADFDDVCQNGGKVTLSGGSPLSGTYSGQWVSGGKFDPQHAVSTYTLTYTYNDPGTGCSNSISKPISVVAPPTLDVSGAAALPEYCETGSQVTLSFATPSGGTYTGTGIVSTNKFDPTAVGVGTHNFTYTFTSATTGCSSSDNFNLKVIAKPDLTWDALADMCVNASALDLSTKSNATSYAATPSNSESFSGAGVSGTDFDPTVAGVGTHTLTYTYGDGVCSASKTSQIVVNPLPTVDFAQPDDVCVDATPFTLTGGSPVGGVYSGTAVSTNSFDPATAGVNIHELTYTYTDGNTCSNEKKVNISVVALPTEYTLDSFDGATYSYCANNSGVELRLSDSDLGVDYTLYKDGLVVSTKAGTGNLLSFGEQPAGTYSVIAENSTSCKRSFTSTVTITENAVPVAPTGVTSNRTNFCEDDASTITLTLQGGSGTQAQWYTDACGASPVYSSNSTANTITIDSPTATTTYYGRWTNGCGVSNCMPAIVNVKEKPSVLMIADQSEICEGTDIKFTATDGYAEYRFKINGTVKQSSVTNEFTTGNLADGDAVSVEVASSDGCWTTVPSISIPVNSLPNTAVLVSSDADNKICVGESVTFTASGANEYEFFLNGSSVQAKSSTATYTNAGLSDGDAVNVVAYSNKGCAYTPASISTQVVDLPAVTIAADETEICEGEEVRFTATNGYASYEFNVDGIWKSASASNLFITSTLTHNQTIQVRATNTQGCEAISNSVAIIVNSLPSPIGFSVDAATICAGEEAVFSASGGAQYEFIVDGSTVQGPAAASTYRSSSLLNGQQVGVWAISSAGCKTASSLVSMTVNAKPTPILNANATKICTGTDVDFTVTSGYDNYKFYVNGGLNQDNGTTATHTITGLNNGDKVKVIATNNGCTAESNELMIEVNPNPTVTLAASDTEICNGGTISFTASSGYANYAFEVNGSSVQTGTDNIFSTSTLSNGDKVAVTVTTSQNCSAKSPETTITVHDLPTASTLTATKSSICNGESVTFTADDGGIGGSKYEFFIGANRVQGPSTDHQFTTTSLNNGDEVSVEVITTNGCTFTPAAINMSVSPKPTVTLGADKTAICAGEEVTFDANGSLFNYNFHIDGVAQGVQAASRFVSSTLTNNQVVYVTAENASGCSGQSDGITITVNPMPATPGFSQDKTTVCEGEEITFTATGGDNYEFLVDGSIVQGPSAASTLRSSTLLNGQKVGVWAITSAGCKTASSQTTVTVNAKPSPILNASATKICSGTDVDFTVTSGFDNYKFYVNGGLVQDNGTTSTHTISNLNNGDKVKILATNNGCSAESNELTIEVNPEPTVTLAASDTEICKGANLSFTASSGYANYDFKVNGSSVQTGTDNVFSSSTLNNGDKVAVKATTSQNCSATSPETTITVNLPPTTATLTTPKTSICDGESVTFTATNGSDYEFFVGANRVQGPSGIATYTTSSLNNGDAVSVKVTSADGCDYTPATINMTVDPKPSVTLNVDETTVCAGDEVTFDANNGLFNYNFHIDGVAQGTQAASRFASTTLTGNQVVYVIAENASGCSGQSDGITITVNPIPTAAALTSSDADNIICEGEEVSFTASGGSSYEFFIDGASVQGPDGQTTYITDKLTNGQTIKALVRNVSGCSVYTSPITTTVNALPDVSLNASVTEVCEGENINFEVASGYANYIFEKNGVSVQNSAANTFSSSTLQNGDKLKAVVQSAQGCVTTTNEVPITINPLPVGANLIASDLSICSGEEVNFTASGGDKYQFFVDGTSVQGPTTDAVYKSTTLSNGQQVKVDVFTNKGCKASPSTLTMQVSDYPTASLIVSDNEICAKETVTVTANAGYDNYIFYVNDTEVQNGAGNTLTTSTLTTDAAIKAEVFNTAGCKVVTSVKNIAVNEAPDESLLISDAEMCANGEATIVIPNAQSGISYQLRNGVANVGVAKLGTGTALSFDLSPTATTTYNLVATSSKGCSVAMTSTPTIVVNSNPSADAGADINTTYGDVVALDATASTGTSLTYSWTPADKLSNANIAQPTFDADATTVFALEVTDSNGCKDEDMVVVNVAIPNVNAVDDAATTDKNTAIVIEVLTNDDDGGLGFDLTKLRIVTYPANGGVTVNSTTGEVTYTPTNNYSGTDQFVYETCNTKSLCDQATVTITVQDVNQPPVAGDDVASTPENTDVIIDVVANDNDPDGTLDLSCITITTAPLNGTVVNINSTTGAITYRPTSNYVGADQFIYEVCDNDGAKDQAKVTITVTQSNVPPVALDDSDETDQGVSVTTQVLVNDSDADGVLDPATLVVSNVLNGTISVDNVLGQVTFNPANGFSGSTKYDYQICDNDGDCDNASVVILVRPKNQPPVAVNDVASTQENKTVDIDVLDNDSDPDGSLVTSCVNVVTAPLNGTIEKIDPATGYITYKPKADYAGADQFTYEMCDADGATATATVSVTVIATNIPPVAVDDSDETFREVPVTTSVLVNDSDADGILDPATLRVLSVLNGTVTINNVIGTVTFTPANGFVGQTEYEYEICDNEGGCAQATVTILVKDLNAPPVAVNDDASTPENTDAIVDVLANDSDSDGTLNPACVKIITAPLNGTIEGIDNLTGKITYRPTTDYIGADRFVYEVCDDDGETAQATVLITVQDNNQPPVAVDDSDETMQNVAVTTEVLANDSDADGILDPATLRVFNVLNGTVTVDNVLGQVTFTPENGFVGETKYEYEICDNDGACAQATVTILINKANQPPVAVEDFDETLQNTPVETIVLLNDYDPDGTIMATTVQVIEQPLNGTVGVDATNGSITYIPNSSYIGVDSYRYKVADNEGVYAETVVEITVKRSNQPPVARNDNDQTTKNTAVTTNVLENDEDTDGTLLPASVEVTRQPFNGTTSVNHTTGYITYTPALNFVGTDTYEYEVCDNEGACANATVTVVVIENNNPPVAVEDKETTDMNVPVVVDVLENDYDDDGTIIPSQTTVTKEALNGTTTVEAASGRVTYTPNQDFYGSDEFIYQITDNDGGTATATVYITVNRKFLPPVAVNDTDEAPMNGEVNTNILFNDYAQEGSLNPVSIEVVEQPLNGSAIVEANGTITYIPGTNFTGKDVYRYKVCDFNGLCAEAKVDITIVNRSNPPAANDDYAEVEQGGLITVDELLNDGDFDNDLDPTSVSIVSDPISQAFATILSDGKIEVDYSAIPNFLGTDTLRYEVCDKSGNCVQANIIIRVTGADGADISVMEGYSPNGDGVNDTYYIPGIEDFPDNKFIVLNRWGSKVYEKVGYSNDWDGKSNVGSQQGEDLPVGVYYFILELNDGSKPQKGWIYLTR